MKTKRKFKFPSRKKPLAERERRITSLGKRIGIKFVFPK